MKSNTPTMTPAMSLALEANFGSLARWRAEFAGLGKRNDRGPGCAVLSFQPHEGTLVNQWKADPTPASDSGVPLLSLHGEDVDALLDSIDWAAVYERYQHAVHDASESFGAGFDEVAGATLIDVRRAGMFEKATTRLPGARWCDPVSVNQWGTALPRDRALVVYCVYGHEVGRSTALRLRSQGMNARFLRGGIDAWQAAGRPIEAKEVTP